MKKIFSLLLMMKSFAVVARVSELHLYTKNCAHYVNIVNTEWRTEDNKSGFVFFMHLRAGRGMDGVLFSYKIPKQHKKLKKLHLFAARNKINTLTLIVKEGKEIIIDKNGKAYFKVNGIPP